jgi:hypothetical protein
MEGAFMNRTFIAAIYSSRCPPLATPACKIAIRLPPKRAASRM